jgi:hypothetical protein
MEGRGRNGWFQVQLYEVHPLAPNEFEVAFYSKRLGGMPPIVVIGEKGEMVDMLRHCADIIEGRAVEVR